ncbi:MULTISPECIES: RNA polymerase sigma factor [unclassified Carboxylicivirga]|uniref:RNA polymerase sigma factor n=1 Tax=Carboxylicivirga TaxID=1628153 RepID=UPI003D32D13A
MTPFETIYTKHYAGTHRLATKLLGQSGIVKDIVQEVFLSLYERRKDADVIEQPGAWLYRATYYKCIDYLKQQSKFCQLENLKPTCDYQLAHEQKETRAWLDQALNILNDKERLLAILYSEDLSYKELALATGIPLNSVGKTLSRTLKKLEKVLKEEYNEMF